MKRNVLDNMSWSFIGEPYSDKSQFQADFIEYQKDINGAEFNDESINELVILAPAIRIQYWCYEDDDQAEKIITLEAENRMAFSIADLMYKLHNAVVNQLKDLDHHFFEGLEFSRHQDEGYPELYKLWQGS